MRKRFFGIILGILISPMLCADGLDAIKGIWSSVESFPLFTSSFWSGIGKSFGGSPTGYVIITMLLMIRIKRCMLVFRNILRLWVVIFQNLVVGA